MHDTFLLDNLAKSLWEICQDKTIGKVEELSVIVHHQSHINEENLLRHLRLHCGRLLSDRFLLQVERGDIEAQTAVIKSIRGETAQ